jgi:beta-glucosidase
VADERISLLTLEQKVAMLTGADSWHTVGYDDPPIPTIRMSDGPAGVRGTSRSGPASASFPCGAALGATFDPALIFELAQALGREAHSKNVHVLLAPTVNLHRTPIGGRNFECISEDPVLTSGIAVAYLSGVQHTGVAACIKHFAANDTEYQRMSISSEVDETTLREAYLVPFEDAVAAGVRVIMSAYNRLNGTFCSEHPWLLTDVLRDEWGFDGIVISDWFGCHSAGPSLTAGLDIEMPGPPIARGGKLVAAVDSGEASEADVDRSIERILALAEWVGAAGSATTEEAATDDETRDVIRRTAIASMVLLKNERSALPLSAGARRIALIGPNAEFGQPQGGGSAEVRVEQVRGPLDALRARGLDVTFERGGRIEKFIAPLTGRFDVEYRDDDGHSLTTTASRTKWFWDQPPSNEFSGSQFGARVRGSLTPDDSGAWEFGANAVGPLTLRLDGETLIDIPAGEHGGTFYGLGSHEHRATIELEAGRAYEIDVDYPVVPDQLIRGMSFGARTVETGDPIARAVEAAASADVAVVVVGTSAEFESEGEDRTTMSLPGEQDALVAAVVAANPNTVVVLNCGSPVTMPWLDDVPAVLQIWFPGQELGEALADVLTGAAEPGGRLPTTFPRDLAETPAAPFYPGTDGTAVYGEGLLIGHRWYDRNDVEPLFPFGHGLGYTTMTIAPAGVDGGLGSSVTVSVDVTNTGERGGSEVVQVYVEQPGDDPARPVRQLAAFQRVEVDAGVTAHADIVVPARAFRRWSADGWIVPAGEHRILVGRSSRSLEPVGTLDLPGRGA